MADLIEKNIGHYRILEKIGEGGMAVVYKAYDPKLDTEVAVKVIRIDDLAPRVLERTLKRFSREAKALAQLTHPNIVKVHDYGEHEGSPYIVIPYISGGTLKEKIASVSMGYRAAARLLLPIVRAMAYAHQEGVIHRDIKPANILLTASGEPLLTDFGIARILENEETIELTMTNAIVGTPDYMSPEQAMGKRVDHRTDIYSLGLVYYEMITGRKPFQGNTPMAVMAMHSRDRLPSPKKYVANLPVWVEKFLMEALAKLPEKRYQSAGEFAKKLEKIALETTAQGRVRYLRRLVAQIGFAGIVLSMIVWVVIQARIQWKSPPSVVITPSLTETIVPPPIATATNSQTPNPPATISVQLQIPVYQTTPLPVLAEPIDINNIESLALMGLLDDNFVEHMAYSPQGDLIAVAYALGIKLYDPKSLTEKGKIDLEEKVEDLAFSYDGSLLYLVGSRRTIQAFRTDDFSRSQVLGGQDSNTLWC